MSTIQRTNLDDDWYAGDDEVHSHLTSSVDDDSAFGYRGPIGFGEGFKSQAYGSLNVDLFYDTNVLPRFLTKKIVRNANPFLGDGKFDDQQISATYSGHQDIKLPVKDSLSAFAIIAKEGSDALRRFRREEAQRKINVDTMDVTTSTINTLIRQHQLAKGEVAMTEEELDKIKRQIRSERLRNATTEERAKIEAEEREEEAKAAKSKGSMKDIDNLGAHGSAPIPIDPLQKKQHYENLRDSLSSSRQRLPVYRCRDPLMNFIADNQVCIIEGETGSGKTTQLVQYLYEEGYTRDGGMIGCTQPRKVAAVGVAKRVADEVGCELGTTVGYAIRLEDRSCADTKIKFMTEGLLLREVIHDPDINKYSVIVLDEAHERSVNTDVLLGILKDLRRRRNDLKIIVTSATMNTAKFSAFFNGAEHFKIPGKVYPVDVVYEPPTTLVKPDYIEDVVNKICEVHLATPLTIERSAASSDVAATLGTKRSREDGETQPDTGSEEHEGTGADILVFLPGKEEIVTVVSMVKAKLLERAKRHHDSLWLVPLYSELSPSEQLKALTNTPKGMRKCVVSTNVAETSLTIDGIRFVIDSGFMKTNVYRPKIGMNTLLTYPISQAEANQRKGRAGRTARGVCYRLYSEDQFLKEMLLTPVPEIQRSSIDSVILLLKSIGVDDLLRFDFIDAPPESTIRDSLYKLWLLSALDEEGRVTKEGRTMLEFPVEPSLARMLLVSTRNEFRCADEMLSIAAMMSVESRSLFVSPPGKEESSRHERAKFNVANSDHLTLLNIFMQFLRSGKSKTWCSDNYLDHRTLQRAVDIRTQFVDRMRMSRLPITAACKSIDEVSERLRQTLVYGYISQVAKRVKWNEYESLQSSVTCFTSPNSAIMEAGGGASMPEYCIYHEFLQTTKEYMCVVTEIRPEWVVEASRGVIRPKGTTYTQALVADTLTEGCGRMIAPVPKVDKSLLRADDTTNVPAETSSAQSTCSKTKPIAKPSALELQRTKLMKQKKTIL